MYWQEEGAQNTEHLCTAPKETRELVGGADQFTALDCAVCREHHEVARRLLGRGGVTVAALRDAAAVKIQAFFRGAVIRDGAA